MPPLDERVPIEYVNGQTFIEGFGAFIIIFLVVCLVGWLIKKHNDQIEREEKVETFVKENDFFQKIEDFRNDFR